jgi:hypothetical protein
LDVGCWMLDVGCWMLDVGSVLQDSSFNDDNLQNPVGV